MTLEKLFWLAVAGAIFPFAVFRAIQYVVDTGVVIDGSTGKPLEGVHVIARWESQIFQGANSTHGCFKVASDISNRWGEFNVSSLSWNFSPVLFDRERWQYFYREGYKLEGTLEETQGKRIVMVPDPRTGYERINYVRDVGGGSGCGSEREQRSALQPVFRAAVDEIRKLASTPGELNGLANALFALEKLDTDMNTVISNYNDRKKHWGIP